MDHGIWAIWYDIVADNRAEYLDWFHHVHIPEKLSRPGYRWAAHYQLGHGGRGAGYVALFGGDSTHTFLNPSPGQLATRLRQRNRLRSSRGLHRLRAGLHLIDEVTQLLGELAVTCARRLRGHLHRDRVEPRVVAIGVAPDQRLDLVSGRHDLLFVP